MRKAGAAIMAATVLIAGGTRAAPFETTDQIIAAGQITAGVEAAILCNCRIDADGLAAVIRSRIAPVGKLTPEMAASLLSTTVTAHETEPMMIGQSPSKATIAQACSRYLGLFGPDGASMRGILKP